MTMKNPLKIPIAIAIFLLAALPLGCTEQRVSGGDNWCGNEIQDRAETDVDCGGECDACDLDAGCAVDADCLSGLCLNEICTDPCTDGALSEGETDVDCGGVCPDVCDLGESCAEPTDCVMDQCTDTICTDPCFDGVLSDGETDVDCGGVCAATCGVGLDCVVDGDCIYDICTGLVCDDTCGNGNLEPWEACDGDEFATVTCQGAGYDFGQPTCDNECTVTTDSCRSCPGYGADSTGTLGNEWTRAGPSGGNITALLALGGNVVLAGTGVSVGTAGARPLGYGSAIYRSTDGGLNFTEQQRFIESNGNTVRRFAQVGSSNVIYAAVSGGTDPASNGMWMSVDAGVSWTQENAGLHASARPKWVVAAPGSPERIYAMIEGTSNSPGSAQPTLYRRDNGGDWNRMNITNVTQVTGGPALALAVHNTNRDKVFLANGDRLFTSTDGGATFTSTDLASSLFTSGPNSRSLFTNPFDDNHLVYTTDFENMIESLDGGATWAATDVPTGGQGDVTFSATQTFVATFRYGLKVSGSSGFEALGGCMVDPGVTAVSIAPDDATKVFVGFNGQGVLHSTDSGETFIPQASGIDDLLATVAVTGTPNAPVAWILSAAGLFRSTDAGEQWERIADGEGTLAFTSITQDPSDANRVLAGTNGDWYQGAGLSMGIFDIDLLSGDVTRPSGLLGASPEINGVAFDPTNALIVYAYQDTGNDGRGASIPTTILRSIDGGLSFSTTGILGGSFSGNNTCSGGQMAMSSAGIPYFCVRPATTDITDTEIFTTTDEGVSFDSTWSGAGGSLFPYSGVFVDSSENMYFAGAGSDGLANSTDGGVTMNDFGTGLIDFGRLTYHVTFTPSGGMLVSTADGAYYAANGVDFVEMNEGLEYFQGTDLLTRAPRARSMAVIPVAGGPDVVLMTTVQGVFRRTLP